MKVDSRIGSRAIYDEKNEVFLKNPICSDVTPNAVSLRYSVR